MTMQNRSQKKPLEYFLDLSYELQIQKAQEGGFVVSVPDLPGCITQVEKWEEAEGAIEGVRREWMRTAYEDGVDIALPATGRQYSGKFVLRIPRSLHKRLDRMAEGEGVSLNTLVVSLISQGMGRRDIEVTPSNVVLGRTEPYKIGWEELVIRRPKQPETLKLPNRSVWQSVTN
jgi:antitoxin HicB